MHLYAFGSICRGELDRYSDVDILAIVNGHDDRFDADKYSIYSYHRLSEIWKAGNPFAWHLYFEAKLLYSDNGSDFIKGLGRPSDYAFAFADCLKFRSIFFDSYSELIEDECIEVYLISNMFLGYRNFATCYSLKLEEILCFSRHAATKISKPLDIPLSVNNIFERCRILSTRGIGNMITKAEKDLILQNSNAVIDWMDSLMEDFKYG